jgi:hypothetical protein
MHIRDEQEFETLVDKLGFEVVSHKLAENGSKVGEDVLLVGHDLVTDTKSGFEVLYPVWTKGIVNTILPHQNRVFVRTPVPVTMGMCGGPVISTDSMECIGMIEGKILIVTIEIGV